MRSHVVMALVVASLAIGAGLSGESTGPERPDDPRSGTEAHIGARRGFGHRKRGQMLQMGE